MAFPAMSCGSRGAFQMNFRKKIGLSCSDGFTLIEMLVVMTIVALLLTIALPRYLGTLDKSKDTALRENLKVMRTTIDKFYGDKGRYPDTLDELVEHRYLGAIPVDPVADTDKAWIMIPARDADRKGVADVRSGAKGQDGTGQPYDTY